MFCTRQRHVDPVRALFDDTYKYHSAQRVMGANLQEAYRSGVRLECTCIAYQGHDDNFCLSPLEDIDSSQADLKEAERTIKVINAVHIHA